MAGVQEESDRKMTRISISFSILLSLALSLAQAAEKKTKTQDAAPKVGVKTPGVQIPFASLKAEAEFEAPGKPDWIFFATSVYAPAKDSIEKIDPKTNKKGGPITGLSKPCGGMASAFNSLWVPVCGTSSGDRRGVAKIDSKIFNVSATIATGVSSARGVIASTADSIWMLTDDKTTLSRIDPEQNQVVGELRLPTGCRSLVFGENSLWLACPDKNKVLRINPATNLVDKSIEVSAEPEALAIGAGSVWALCRKDGKIDRIDPKTDKVTKTIELGVPGAEGELAFGDSYLWVTQTGFPLARVDVKSETVLQQFIGEGGGAMAVSPGAIWLSNINAGSLWRIDMKRVFTTIPE
jgi:virginiamycin B lyase